MPPTIGPWRPEFRLHDDVRLLSDRADVESGTQGRILGRYARESDPTYLVRFGDCVCNDVRADELVLCATEL